MRPNLLEDQFQWILAHYMYSWWTSVEVRNGIFLGNDILFPIAKAYSPYEDRINDMWQGWGRDIDLLLMDRDCRIYIMEMKREPPGKIDFLELLAQAYCSAYWLSTISPSRLPEIFHHSLLFLYGATNRKPEDLPAKLPKSLKDPENGLFEVHKKFYDKARACDPGDIDMTDSTIVLALNPGARFAKEVATLTGFNAGEIANSLRKTSRQVKRLHEIPGDYKRPVRLLEFDLDLSMRECPTAG